MVLLDRQRFPRDKVCGDFVGPAALVELEHLGVTTRAGYAASNVIRSAALHLDGLELIHRAIPSVGDLPAYGRCIPRLVLDAWLLDAARRAGATIRERVKMTGFEVDPDGVSVRAITDGGDISLRARLLIGADGSTSLVAREIRGGAPPGSDRIIAVRSYAHDVAGPEDRADLYFSAPSFPGYYWMFPLGAGRANVGIGMVLETIPKSSDHLRSLLLACAHDDAALATRLGPRVSLGNVIGWPLTTYDPRLPIVADRVMLVGDAAGFINPLNGEGIQYALLSGRWAADCARACLHEEDFSERRLHEYSTRAERELRLDMAMASLIVQLIRQRHLTDLWLASLRVIAARARNDTHYAEIVGGILAGLLPAREALSWHVVARTADQAFQSALVATAIGLLRDGQFVRGRVFAATHMGIALARQAIEAPGANLGWLLGVLRHGVELGAQLGTELGARLSVGRGEGLGGRPGPATRRAAASGLPIPVIRLSEGE